MKNIIYSFVGILFHVHLIAQVGINTTEPNSTLDVNGKTTLRKELRVGGTSTQVGNAGLNGQVLVSQGEGLPPVWRSLNTSFMEDGQYKLINSFLKSDQLGIVNLSEGVSGDNIYTSSVGDDITDVSKGRWVRIPGLEEDFTIKNDRNILTYQFQTGIEMKSSNPTESQDVNFICGAFRDNKLVAMRVDKIISTNNPDKLGFQDYSFTLNYTETNVPLGDHKVEVACRKIEASNINTQFVIGRNINNANTISNPFVLESVFKLDVIGYINYKSN